MLQLENRMFITEQRERGLGLLSFCSHQKRTNSSTAKIAPVHVILMQPNDFRTVSTQSMQEKKRQYSKEDQDVNRQDVRSHTRCVTRLRVIYLCRHFFIRIIPLIEDHLLQIKQCLHSSGQETQKAKQKFLTSPSGVSEGQSIPH